jgi:hypothetical protein
VDRAIPSQWRELILVKPGLTIPFLWNPQRRLSKTLSDFVAVLLAHMNSSKEFEKLAHVTIEYLLILNIVMEITPNESDVHRQFAIVQSHGFCGSRSFDLLLVSRVHRLG